MNSDIDIVVAWVDGSDPLWRKEKAQYTQNIEITMDGSDERYRDWSSFRYWFRGIEMFAPWARKIHLVTWGHIPKWLNTKCEKLNIVRHNDYMPQMYLPTFSANTIELNLHRIKGLSNKFIYFNDDMFLIKETKPQDFFKKGIPCDSALLCPHCYSEKAMGVFTPFTNIGVINSHFDMKNVVNSHKTKWFNFKYGKFLIGNIIMLSNPRFPGMRQQHLPQSFLKSTFEKVWKIEPEILDRTCSHKFRDKLDVNQWLMKEWQIAEGNFVPRTIKIGKSFMLTDIDRVCDFIENQRGKMMCINDSNMSIEVFNQCAKRVDMSFSKIMKKKSKFEI